MKAGKVIRNTVIGIIALVLVLLVSLQILLRPQVLTRIVNQVAADYVDGNVSFREVRAHVIKSFPHLNLSIQDFSITYPHSRYARYDSVYTENTRRRFSLLKAGNGENGTDTLAAFGRLDMAVDYMALLGRKVIHVHRLELSHPRIFAHYYDSTAANWDILPIGGNPKDTVDKESKALPEIVLDRIALTDRPFIIYTNPADTLHGAFSMRRLELDGKLESARLYQSHARLAIDSLLLSGRLPSDTVSFRLHQLRSSIGQHHLDLVADAQASLRTGEYGRMRIPIHLDADADLPEHGKGELEAIIRSLNLSLSALSLSGEGRIFKHKDGIMDLDLKAGIKDCPLGEIAREFQDNILALRELPTEAILMSASAHASGQYGNGHRPDVSASIDKLLVDVWGARISATASVKDVLGRDPLVTLNGHLKARVDSLARALAGDLGYSGTGLLSASLDGRARLSQLSMATIGQASLKASLEARDLDVRNGQDSLEARIPLFTLSLETKANEIDRNLPKGARVLALKADVDSLDASLKDMFLRGGRVQLLAQNSADILKGGKELTSLMGILKLGSLRLRDSDGMGLTLQDNTETFRVEPATPERPAPRLTLRSKSSRLRARLDANMMGARDFGFDLSATRHIRRVPNPGRMNRLLDSLQRVYPDAPRDSLFRRAMRERMASRERDPFAQADIQISLSDAIRSYVRDWDVQGHIGLESARVRMPAFPLQTMVHNVEGSFDNDTLNLKNITLKAGASDLSAQASLTGLRRAMLGRGRSLLKLKASVTSDYIDANELLRGYAFYSTYKPSNALAEASDEAVESAVDHAQLPDTAALESKLLVIPSNLDVAFSLEAAGIKYDSLLVNWAAADIAMRDRTLQITNALAASNMGDIYFEGFYSTRNKEEIKAGFDLNLVDITAGKVITLFPAIDTLMPLLTTFQGNLDCELAATTDIDTLMNVVLPSVDGIIRISGKDLGLKESPQLTKITRLLMFRNKKEARINNMSVTGIVQNNILEIFPFVLDVDRYMLAASGTQHLSQEFDYHVSVIKSPLILKFGLNVWGPDFDHIHYGLGRARYRSANVPVFTQELNNVQYNLIGAIHNIFDAGVEKALEENRTGQYFGTVSGVSEAPVADESVSEDALKGMETFLTDVMEQTTTRREALKQEVIRLEAQASKQE